MSATATPPERVPTLTEVVHWPETPVAVPTRMPPAPEATSGAPSAASLLVAAAGASTAPASAASVAPLVRAPVPTGPLSVMPSPHEKPAAVANVQAPVAVPAGKPAAGADGLAFVGAAAAQNNQEQLTQQIFADLQRQVELMLEYRLRETLAPLLARAADSIVRDARTELASTLRDVVARAVAQELARHRNR